MPEKKDHSPRPEPGPLGAGARMLVRRRSEPAQTGRIIEDYAELTDTEERGHACSGAPVGGRPRRRAPGLRRHRRPHCRPEHARLRRVGRPWPVDEPVRDRASGDRPSWVTSPPRCR